MISRSIDIWENDIYQGEGGDGFRPILDTYILDGERKRGAVLICPGGCYSFTADREAEAVALQFNAAGYHAFVLYYSVAPRRHPQPLLDVSKSMCLIRENADKWNILPDQIAVCGFSAGGHLAASLGVHWDKPYLQQAKGIKPGMNQPNACILCYPVITSGEFAHRESFNNLLGENATQDMLYDMSLEHQISKKTPPVFIWHTFDDDLVPVENSLLFAKGLRTNNLPFEMHIFPHGLHGLSLATEETETKDKKYGVHPHIATWIKLCIEWLDEI